jgi:type II secretory pathway pseudopilin PulG
MKIRKQIVTSAKFYMRYKAKGMQGVTFVDITMVIMIMAILSMIAIPSVNTWVLDSRLSRASAMMVSGIEYTAGLSTRYKRSFHFNTNMLDNSFNITDSQPYPDPIPPEQHDNTPPVNTDGVVWDPVLKNWYTIDFDNQPNLRDIKLSGPTVLTFDPHGNAPIVDSQYVLSAGNQTKTIIVVAINGKIIVN